MATVSAKRGTPHRVNGEPYGGDLIERKLAEPRPVFKVLRRTRLLGLLDTTTSRRVTLVSAPAGSGKTTACASWAAEVAGKTKIGWLSLDSLDNDPTRFRTYLLAAMRRAQPALPLAGGVDGSATDEFLLRLIKAAEQLAEPLVLILDDVHELTDRRVLAWLDRLVTYAPPMLRLILSCRRSPRLKLARLRVSGDLADIGAFDLACTPEEAEAYFATLGLDVDPADQRALLQHTEGWMAGIRLAALRSQVHPPSVGILEITGDDPHVTDYLRDEVLTRQDPAVRAFLLRTCVVAHLTGKLADALTGKSGGARRLDHLSRDNTFVYALDTGRSWYRYHRLLRELLLAELRREMPHEIPILQRRAARWYARHGRPADALRSSVAAQDWGCAAQVLAAGDVSVLLSHGPAQLGRMLAAVPADLALDNVAISAALAATRLWRDDPDGARAHLDAAGAGLDRAAAPMRQIMGPKLVALQVMRANCRACADDGLLAQAWRRAEQSARRAGAQTEHRALGILWLAIGVAYLRRSELPRARQALRAADRELGAGDFADLQLRARMWWALAEAWHGNLAAAEAAVTQALNTDPPPAAATQHIGRLALALVNLMRDELALVHRLLDQLDHTEHAPMPGEPSLMLSADLIRARTLIAQGDAGRAQAMLSRLRERFGRSSRTLTDMTRLLEAEMAVRSPDSDLGRTVIARLTSEPAGMGERLALSWLLLARADPRGALDAVEPCVTERGEDVRLHERIGALVACAVAHRRLKAPRPAAALLEEALVLAEPESAYRAFIDGGAAVRSVLTVLVSPTSSNAGFAGKILRRLDSRLQAGSSSAEGDALPLSESELAVLRFLPSHLTNEEIGAALFLSVNTVKTHLRSAYRKLGVRSRRDAVALARRRGLVS